MLIIEKKIRVLAKDYQISLLEILHILNNNSFGRLLIKLSKLFGLKRKIKVNPLVIEVVSIYPSILNKEIPSDIVNINKRKYVFKKLYLELNKTKRTINFSNSDNNSFYAISLILKNRDHFFNRLLSKGIECNKMWTNPLCIDVDLNKKWKLNKTPNAEKISKEILNILINPRLNEEEINFQIREISEIFKNHSV